MRCFKIIEALLGIVFIIQTEDFKLKKKLIIMSCLLLIANIGLAEEFENVYSPEEAAHLLLDKKCGGRGEFVSIEELDQDFDFKQSLVIQTNGEAFVYSRKKTVDDKEVVYYSIDEYECY